MLIPFCLICSCMVLAVVIAMTAEEIMLHIPAIKKFIDEV